MHMAPRPPCPNSTTACILPAKGGRNSRETTAGASKRKGIRAKPRRERRNHSGSVETKAPPHSVRRCGPQPKRAPTEEARRQRRPELNHSKKGQTRPEQARRGRNSRETTAGASKRKGIRAKPRRERETHQKKKLFSIKKNFHQKSKKNFFTQSKKLFPNQKKLSLPVYRQA